MKIAMVTSESNPLIKSGGLADVVYSLGKELVKMGEEVSIFLPYYNSIKHKFPNLKTEFVDRIEVSMSWRHQIGNIYLTKIDGINFYLVENRDYFERDNLYGYGDDGERFAFLDLFIRDFIIKQNLCFDVIHVHDWQAAILPCLIKETARDVESFKNTKFVLTIHNEAFQGSLDKFFIADYFGLSDSLYDEGKVRLNGMFSTLKAGIVYSDVITTVSPTHRDELLTREQSFGLSGVLEARRSNFYGIVNGVDVEEFNPKKDKFISSHYSLASLQTGKTKNKHALLNYFSLEEGDGPVYGLVSRLTWQKGINLIFDVADKIIANNGYLVVLGSGEADLENNFKCLKEKYPNRVGVYIGYSNEIAHKIYAGSDFFLMPSLFEPCGIGQMNAKLYATLPLVREVGGLKDTVLGFNGYNEGVADGISFMDFDIGGINYAIDMSLELYSNKDKFKQVRINAINSNHSWNNSAKEYLKIYKNA